MIALTGLPICNMVDPPTNNGQVALGTIGGIVNGTDNKNYLITCYHCIYNHNLNFDDFQPDGVNNLVKTVISGSFQPLGTVTFAIRTAKADLALIQVNDGFLDSVNFPGAGVKMRDPALNNNDSLKVHLVKNGNMTGNTSGMFQCISNDITGAYIDTIGDFSFSELVKVDGLGGPFAVEGDSGSLIMDDNKKLCGMIVLRDKLSLAAYGLTTANMQYQVPIIL